MSRQTTLSRLLLAVLGTVSLGASAAPSYTITPVGLLGSPYVVDVVGALNNSGQLAGYAYDNNQLSHAYLYSKGTRTDLNPPGAQASRASGLNDAGTVVGTLNYGDGNDHAAVFNGNGSVTDLGTLGGSSSYANGINNAGTVAGTSYVAADSTFHAFVTQGGKLVDIGTLVGAGGYSEAVAINQLGQAVGYSLASDGGQHAFSYLNGAMSDLGTLGGMNSTANAVNASGAVAGYAYLAGDALAHAFIYANGTMADLGTMGATVSFAYDINDAGEAVGRLETDNADGSMVNGAFLYSGGQMTDLNSLIDPAAGWNLQWASAINDLGQIEARGCRTDGNCQDLLLTRMADGGDPASNVPEPEAFTAGIAGLALFGLLRRRRKQK